MVSHRVRCLTAFHQACSAERWSAERSLHCVESPAEEALCIPIGPKSSSCPCCFDLHTLSIFFESRGRAAWDGGVQRSSGVRSGGPNPPRWRQRCGRRGGGWVCPRGHLSGGGECRRGRIHVDPPGEWRSRRGGLSGGGAGGCFPKHVPQFEWGSHPGRQHGRSSVGRAFLARWPVLRWPSRNMGNLAWPA